MASENSAVTGGKIIVKYIKKENSNFNNISEYYCFIAFLINKCCYGELNKFIKNVEKSYTYPKIFIGCVYCKYYKINNKIFYSDY